MTKITTRMLVTAVLLALAGAAQAQAIFLARKAIGRIEQMTQSSPAQDGGAGVSYDVATVIIDAAPDKVFAAAARRIGDNSALRVTRSDAAKRAIDFTKGKQIGGIQVNALSDDVAQLLISTARSGSPEMDAASIVGHVLDICRQLDVVCQRPDS